MKGEEERNGAKSTSQAVPFQAVQKGKNLDVLEGHWRVCFPSWKIETYVGKMSAVFDDCGTNVLFILKYFLVGLDLIR